MLLEINFTLVIFAISFLIFIYLLNLTLYKPLGEIIKKRKDLIEGNYLKAKELTNKANELLESYKQEIKLAKLDAHNIMQDAFDKAQKVKEEKISGLLNELNNEKETVLKQMHIEKEKVMKELQEKITQLTELITIKILGFEEKTLVKT